MQVAPEGLSSLTSPLSLADALLMSYFGAVELRLLGVWVGFAELGTPMLEALAACCHCPLLVNN